MLSFKKSKTKRILITIIIVFFVFSIASFVATKLIYDSIFTRTDTVYSEPPSLLSPLIEKRETYKYNSGENKLEGYLYRSEAENKNDALIILAPGFGSSVDNYIWQIKELVDYGWSVFAFNPTGSFSSEGDSTIGFPQELLDIKETLKYIEINKRFGYNDIILFGHSRGGYAACCALKSDYDIKAVVSVSGINSTMDGIIGASVNKIGEIAYLNYGFLWLYQGIIFDFETVNLSADDIISESNVPVLIIHGSDDKVVPSDKYSIYSQKESIKSDKVEFYLSTEESKNGHQNLLFDNDGTANDELFCEINSFLKKSIY